MEFCDEPFALGLNISPPILRKSVFRLIFHLGKPSADSESPVILVAPAALVITRGKIEPVQFERKEEKGWDDLFKQNKNNKTTKSKKPAEDPWSRDGGSWHRKGLQGYSVCEGNND